MKSMTYPTNNLSIPLPKAPPKINDKLTISKIDDDFTIKSII